LELVIEPRYRHQKITEFRWQEYFEEDGTRIPLNEEPKPVQSPAEYRLVNSWWSDRLRTKIMIYHDKWGHARVGAESENGLWFALRTMEAAAAWPIQAEERAQKKLATLIPAHLFETYMLTGHYHEVSERSGVAYIFRRGRCSSNELRRNREINPGEHSAKLHGQSIFGLRQSGPRKIAQGPRVKLAVCVVKWSPT
jgi:hypothetical protein